MVLKKPTKVTICLLSLSQTWGCVSYDAWLNRGRTQTVLCWRVSHSRQFKVTKHLHILIRVGDRCLMTQLQFLMGRIQPFGSAWPGLLTLTGRAAMTAGKHRLHRKASLDASATSLPDHWL